MIWREKRLLLIVLAVLLAANTIFFFTYRVQYENRLQSLDEQRDTVKAELDAAKHSRVVAEQQLAGYHKVEKDIRQIYDDEWSTQNERLSPFIGEVMRLATASQLVPRSYAFGGNQTKGVAKTASANAMEVSIGFPVEGTYQQIRTLINRLETSEQFIIIDQITLGSENGAKLNMTIRVKTLFRGTAAGPRASNQEL
ncbi:MAG TPA: hypothetical protein VF505_13210 [Thermoanaerobaculia bacterium]